MTTDKKRYPSLPIKTIGGVPLNGQLRYVWRGGMKVRDGELFVPGIVTVPIVDGNIEPAQLMSGRWLPILVVEGRRYRLDEVVIPENPSEQSNPNEGSYALTIEGREIVYVGDGTYEMKG